MAFYPKNEDSDMKRYIRANTEKPILDNIETIWREFGDKSGIVFSILSDQRELVFEEVFDYDDVDPDNIYDSAVDMAILILSQKYELTDDAIRSIKES